MIRVTNLFLAVFFIPCVLASNLPAQDEPVVQEKIHAVKRHVQELLEEAEIWDKKGWETKADGLRKKARDMKRELSSWLKHLGQKREAKGKRGKDMRRGEDPKRILAGLLAGARSLRQLGRAEQAEQLEEIAEDLARNLQGHSARKAKDRESQERGTRSKKEVVKHHLHSMRIAVEALVEAERRGSAERIEHFMHAVELGMEGRKDKKSQRIRNSAPKPQQILEDLEIAVRFLREEGAKEEAGAVLETLRHLARRVKAQGKRDEEGEDEEEDGQNEDGEDEDADEDEDEDEEAEERIEELEERMKKMERYLEKMKRALEKSTRRR